MKATSTASRARILGLVSDTHGYFDPHLPELLRGVDRILHAGDIGDETVVEQLQRIAPVSAIRGNIDETSRYPASCVVLWGGMRIRLIHDINDWTDEIRAVPVEVVVCGHSHHPQVRNEDGVLIVNPGSAGKKRFQLPRTCARLWREGGQIRVEYMNLETPKRSKYSPDGPRL